MPVSITDVTANIQQIENDAASHLDYIKNKIYGKSSELPIASQTFPSIVEYQNRLSTFFDDVSFSYTIDNDITHIANSDIVIEPNTYFTYSDSGDKIPADTVFKIDSAKTLKDLLTDITAEKPSGSVNNVGPTIPVILLATFPQVPYIDQFDYNKYGLEKRPLYDSSYLELIHDYFTTITVDNNIKEVFNVGIIKKINDLKLTINSEFSKLADRGFRKPNSALLFNCRDHYEKFIYSLLDISKEYVDSIGSLLISAKKLGIGAEQIQLDFTKHINDIKSELLKFDLEVYTAKLNLLISKYNLLAEQAGLKITAYLSEAEYSVFEAKIAQITQEQELAKLRAKSSYNKGVLSFSNLYSSNNKQAIEHKLLQLEKKLFEKQSEQFKKQTDIDLETLEFNLETEFTKTNKAVTDQQKNILSTDLKAYEYNSELHGAKVKAILSEFDSVQKELLLKIAAYSELDKLALASNEVVRAINASNIELATTKGSGDPSWL